MICQRQMAKSQLYVAACLFFGLGFFLILLYMQIISSTQLSTLQFLKSQKIWFQPNASDLLNKSKLDDKLANYFNKTLTLEGKGVISEVHGGIGNQLYQYACAYALARDLNRPLFNFVSAFIINSQRKFLPDQRSFALDNFQIPLVNLIDESTSYNESSVSNINDSQLLFRTYPTDKTFLNLNGNSYCTSEVFWAQYKDDIIDMFQIRPEVIQEFPPYVTNLGKEIENSVESVAVHVRRGDFRFINGGAWLLPISYQRDSIVNISRMLQQRQETNGTLEPVLRPKFFVFSDDIEYCRKELEDLGKVHDLVFVSLSNGTTIRTTSLQDFFLMTKCKHFIIPNSTFGWWAAYLGTHKRKGNGSSDSNSDGIVIASDYRPGFFRAIYKTKEKFNFYYNVIHGTVLFPKGWIVYRPTS